MRKISQHVARWLIAACVIAMVHVFATAVVAHFSSGGIAILMDRGPYALLSTADPLTVSGILAIILNFPLGWLIYGLEYAIGARIDALICVWSTLGNAAIWGMLGALPLVLLKRSVTASADRTCVQFSYGAIDTDEKVG